MDIINVMSVIFIVSDYMFPITPLPHRKLTTIYTG